jgi:hypothetical protein
MCSAPIVFLTKLALPQSTGLEAVVLNDLLRFVELVALRTVAMSENAAELYGEEESGPEPVLEPKFKKRHYNRTLKFWGAVQRYISERAATTCTVRWRSTGWSMGD